MPRTSTFPLTDRVLGGELAAMLRDWREAGDSHETIAYRLRSDHDVTISKSTVQRWCIELEIDTPATPSPDGGEQGEDAK